MVLYNIIPRRKNNALRVNDPFGFFSDRMSNFFDGVFGETQTALAAFSPRLDVTENDKEISVTVELPGVDQKDLKLSIENGYLTIEGEKKEETESKEKGYHHIERSFGTFRRVISLNAKIEENKVKAKFRKGVLTIKLPKTPQPKNEAKTIPVQ